MIKRSISLIILFIFMGNSAVLATPGAGVMGVFMPAPQQTIQTSGVFTPPLLKGMRLDPQDPFAFEFILDTGDVAPHDPQLNQTFSDLVQYYLAGLTIPQEELWVNLSPYEKERITSPHFGETRMGRDLLAQDYLLKQLTSSLLHPEHELGKQYWQVLYQRIYEKTGQTYVDTDTLHKVWIAPDYAKIVVKDNQVWIIDSRLKVMLEQDYINEHNQDRASLSHQRNAAESQTLDVMREIMIPHIEKEINQGAQFAPLRQIYHAMVLAVWMKKQWQHKQKKWFDGYIDRHKVDGVRYEDELDVQAVYQQYLSSAREGLFSLVRDEVDTSSQEIVPRKYIAGGGDFIDLDKAFISVAAQQTRSEDYQGHGVLLRGTGHFRDSAMTSTDVFYQTAPHLSKYIKQSFVRFIYANEEQLQPLDGGELPIEFDDYDILLQEVPAGAMYLPLQYHDVNVRQHTILTSMVVDRRAPYNFVSFTYNTKRKTFRVYHSLSGKEDVFWGGNLWYSTNGKTVQAVELFYQSLRDKLPDNLEENPQAVVQREYTDPKVNHQIAPIIRKKTFHIKENLALPPDMDRKDIDHFVSLLPEPVSVLDEEVRDMPIAFFGKKSTPRAIAFKEIPLRFKLFPNRIERKNSEGDDIQVRLVYQQNNTNNFLIISFNNQKSRVSVFHSLSFAIFEHQQSRFNKIDWSKTGIIQSFYKGLSTVDSNDEPINFKKLIEEWLPSEAKQMNPVYYKQWPQFDLNEVPPDFSQALLDWIKDQQLQPQEAVLESETTSLLINFNPTVGQNYKAVNMPISYIPSYFKLFPEIFRYNTEEDLIMGRFVYQINRPANFLIVTYNPEKKRFSIFHSLSKNKLIHEKSEGYVRWFQAKPMQFFYFGQSDGDINDAAMNIDLGFDFEMAGDSANVVDNVGGVDFTQVTSEETAVEIDQATLSLSPTQQELVPWQMRLDQVSGLFPVFEAIAPMPQSVIPLWGFNVPRDNSASQQPQLVKIVPMNKE